MIRWNWRYRYHARCGGPGQVQCLMTPLDSLPQFLYFGVAVAW